MRVYAGMDPALPLREVPAYIRRVEGLGYDGVRIPESVHDALTVATLAVEHSRRLQVGTGVMLAFPRSPMVLAIAAWDLQALSGGRFVLGLGSQVRGNMIGRFSGTWAPPVPRMRDYISSLRAIWAAFQSGSPLTHHSEHYTFTRLQPLFNPGPIADPDLPIALGAVNPGMCRLAGAAADELITHPTNSSRDYLRTVVLPNMRAGSTEAGRDTEVDLTAMVPLLTAATPRELDAERDRQRHLFAQLFSTPNYSATLQTLGWGAVGEQLHALSRDGRWGQMDALITDGMLDVIAPAALHDDIAGALLRRYGDTATGLLLMPPDTAVHDGALRAVIAALRAAEPQLVPDTAGEVSRR